MGYSGNQNTQVAFIKISFPTLAYIVFYFLINEGICYGSNNNIVVMFESAFFPVLENELCPFRSESFKDFNLKSFFLTYIRIKQERIDCNFSSMKKSAAFAHLPSSFPIWSEIESSAKIVFPFAFGEIRSKNLCITSMQQSHYAITLLSFFLAFAIWLLQIQVKSSMICSLGSVCSISQFSSKNLMP